MARAANWARLACSVAVVTAVAIIDAGAAHAQQSPADIEAKIDSAWRELEPIIEEHNAIRIELADRRAEADELAEKIEPLEQQVELARSEVVEVAVAHFKGGNLTAVNALLSTGSPTTFADRLTVLDQFARSQRETIARAEAARQVYEAEQAELEALVDELAETEQDLAERADEIDAEIDRLQQLHDELVEQERQREESAGTGSGSGSGEESVGSCPVSYPGGGANAALDFACAQIGKPYGWGQAGPDAYDCSGLTMAAWEKGGVSLPHNAAQQRNTIAYVDRSDLRPGDLVFYYSDLSHVGMYIGGSSIVHSSRAGVPVRVSPMDQMPIHSYGRP